MADAPVQLLIAAFQDEGGASAALQMLKEAKKEKLVAIKDAAVLRKDPQGKLHVNDVRDMTGTRGAAIGGVVGAGLGILTGGAALAIAGIGALAGGLAAKLRDSGFNDARLKKLGEGLTPGSSAIVAVIEHTWVADLQEEFQKAGAEVVTEAIAADIAKQLEAGRNTAYTAISSDEGIAASQIVTEEQQRQQDRPSA
jgi:uncharacterized membrane protein